MSKFDDDTLAFMIEFDQEGYEAILHEEGMLQILCKLVLKNIITIEQAIEDCSFTKERFLNELEEFKKDGVN